MDSTRNYSSNSIESESSRIPVLWRVFYTSFLTVIAIVFERLPLNLNSRFAYLLPGFLHIIIKV